MKELVGIDTDMGEEIDILEVQKAKSRLPEDCPSPEITIVPRAYQIEMFEHSMKGNTIITMDTGSGKTHIAKLRIEAELLNNPGKLIWFTTPKVVLAIQQHAYLLRHLPAYQHRLIIGSDNPQYWSTQTIWDSVLQGIDIVVSTPQILVDCLSHGFIKLGQISLLVHDEAHWCMNRNPVNTIMQSFYHPMKDRGDQVKLPAVLGLTASPVLRGRPKDLEKLEMNLDAVCKTPTIQLEEYREYVHQPVIVRLEFQPNSHYQSRSLQCLIRVVESLEIESSTIVKKFFEDERDRQIQQHSVAQNHLSLTNITTKCLAQLKSLLSNAQALQQSLGAWTSIAFLKECTEKLNRSVQRRQSQLSTTEHDVPMFLNAVLYDLRQVTASELASTNIIETLSPKATVLFEFLQQEYKPGLTSIIFVKRRSTAWALERLISQNPSMNQFAAASFVGSASTTRVFELSDLADIHAQKKTFAMFRAGKKNVCVATQVMEEGVDIQSMNLVIRFDEPENFRSYIQSRGRARQIDSKFIMMCQTGDEAGLLHRWLVLEEFMKKQYSDDLRHFQALASTENMIEEGNRSYRVETTEYVRKDIANEFDADKRRACLTLHNAKQHLEHFCATLPGTFSTDILRPLFVIRKTDTSVTAKVVLPSNIHPTLRVSQSLFTWRTEKMATNDAAFEAYVALHRAGLVNDNLLPIHVSEAKLIRQAARESRKSYCRIAAAYQPKFDVSETGKTHGPGYVHQLQVLSREESFQPFLLVLPRSLSTAVETLFHQDESIKYSIKISAGGFRGPDQLPRSLVESINLYLMSTIFQRRMPTIQPTGEYKFSGLAIPDLPRHDLEQLLENAYAMIPLTEILRRGSDLNQSYIVRRAYDRLRWVWRPHSADGKIIQMTGTNGELEEGVGVTRLSKQVNFLSQGNHVPKEKSGIAPLSECWIENIPPSYVRPLLLLPSVLHVARLAVSAEVARQSVLKSVGFCSLELVMSALTAPGASSSWSYERLEFLGDCLLKLFTSLQLFVDFPLLGEGHLSIKRSNVTNNARLNRAVLDSGLGEFIITEAFAGSRWRPAEARESEECLTTSPDRRVSAKLPADVAEAILGAAFVESRNLKMDWRTDSKCVEVLKLFLPEIPWRIPTENLSAAYYPLPRGATFSQECYRSVEKITGYAFTSKELLIEALTHSTLQATKTYDRLEFLGDAILDYIVDIALYDASEYGQRYNPSELSHRRHACVSMHFLAYLCFGASTKVDRVDISTNPQTRVANTKRTQENVYLWQFIRVVAEEVSERQLEAFTRFKLVQKEIDTALQSGKTFPWRLLTCVGAPKWISDIVESLLAAIMIDSGGSLHACKEFLAKIGFIKYLDRLARENDLMTRHPGTVLTEALGKDKPKVEKWFVEGAGGLTERSYGCKILRGEKVMAEEVRKSADEAYCAACEEAITVLENGGFNARR